VEDVSEGPLGRDCSRGLLQRRGAHSRGLVRYLVLFSQDAPRSHRGRHLQGWWELDGADRPQSDRRRGRSSPGLWSSGCRSRPAFHGAVREPPGRRGGAGAAAGEGPKSERLCGAVRAFHQTGMPPAHRSPGWGRRRGCRRCPVGSLSPCTSLGPAMRKHHPGGHFEAWRRGDQSSVVIRAPERR
jgi:hypothetical protein